MKVATVKLASYVMFPFTIPPVTHWLWSSSLSSELVTATGETSINVKVSGLTTVEMSADPLVAVTTVVTGTSVAPSSGIVEISPVGGGGSTGTSMMVTFNSAASVIPPDV